MGNVSTIIETLKRRKTRASEAVAADETETLSRLRSKNHGSVSFSEPIETPPEGDGRVLRSKKRKLSAEANDANDDARRTRSQGQIEQVDNARRPDSRMVSSPFSSKEQQQSVKTHTNPPHESSSTHIEKQSSARPATRSQHATENTATSPIRFRPSVGQWKGPALTAHVDTEHTRQSLFLRDMNLWFGVEDESTESIHQHSSFKVLDNIPDDNIVYYLSVTELLDDYEDRANRNALIDKIIFGNTIESALSAIQKKLKQLEQYDVVEEGDVEEEIREYKRSLKSLALLRESECLVRFREMEEDKENQLRLLSLGVQTVVTPVQSELSELCDRKIWWVGDKEWLKGSERSCLFGAKCPICLRKMKPKKSNKSKDLSVSLKMPRVSIFDPNDYEETETTTEDSSSDVRRYKSRSIEMQKKATVTRIELQRLQASLSFVDHYNRTCTQFLPG